MNDKNLVAMVGVVCLTAIEITALVFEKDGVMLSAIVGAITGLVGLCFGIKLSTKK